LYLKVRKGIVPTTSVRYDTTIQYLLLSHLSIINRTRTIIHMRTLDLLTICSFAALVDRTHGFSGRLLISLKSLHPCTRCAVGVSCTQFSHNTSPPPPLNARVKATWISSSKDDSDSESTRSPMKLIIDTMQSNPTK
jgi:hypothetical protein